MNLSCQNINLLNNQASVFPPFFNPSDTKGFGTTSDTKGGVGGGGGGGQADLSVIS